MTENKNNLLNLLNEKYQLNEDEALTKQFQDLLDKISEDMLQFYINCITRRLPQRKGSKKSKNARENLFDITLKVVNGYYSEKDVMDLLNPFRFEDLKKNLEEGVAIFGGKDEQKALKELDNMEKAYLNYRSLLEQEKDDSYEKVNTKTLSSLAVGLIGLKVPTGHEKTYKNEKNTEEWMVTEYGEGNKAVVHIEGGGKFKKDGVSYTEVSLFLNVDAETPIVAAVPINESSVKMADNKGYKVRIAVPNLPKLTDASGFIFDKAIMHEILNNPETAKILSISEYTPKVVRKADTGDRYNCKGCTKELMFDSTDVDKLIDFKTLMSVNTDATVKIKEVLEKAEANEKTKGHIKQYGETLRRDKIKATFTTVMSDNDAFKVAIGDILESSLKGQSAWQIADKTNWFGQKNEGTEKVDVFLANDSILHIESSEPMSSEIKFSIDRVTKDDKTGAERTERITGSWNTSRQYFPQKGMELATSLANDLMNHPHLLTLEKFEQLDKFKNITFSKEIPDSSGIKRDIEKAIAENTDSIGRNGYDCLDSWNDILVKASALYENSINDVIEKDKAIEVPFSRDSSAIFKFDTKADKIEVLFKRPLNEKEIASMPVYTPVSKNGKSGVEQKVVNGTMTLTGTVEIPAEMKGEQLLEKGKILQFLINSIKEGKVKPVKTNIEGQTPNGKLRMPHFYENEVRTQEKEKGTQVQDDKKGKDIRKFFGRKTKKDPKGGRLD